MIISDIVRTSSQRFIYRRFEIPMSKATLMEEFAAFRYL